MSRDNIPTREADLLAWSRDMAQHLSATPDRFNMSAEWAQQYQSLHDDFAALYDKANDPSTRTPLVIAEKNGAKDALIAEARRISRWIQAQITTTDAMRMTLGLNIPKKKVQRIKPPSESPSVDVVNISGSAITIRLCRADGRRAKPEGVKSASVYAFVGEHPPHDLKEWQLVEMTTRTVAEIKVSGMLGGTNVWLCARWHNPRGESGPASKPTTVFGQSHVLRLAA